MSDTSEISSDKPVSLRRELLRKLPAVDALLRSEEGMSLTGQHGLDTTTSALRQAVEITRNSILDGREMEISAELVAGLARDLLSTGGLLRVVNATGVVLHTNLGRSVLPQSVVGAVVDAATGYSNLEYDLGTGKRGSRYDHSVPLLKRLTGAEDALVVNNCAGATLLALAAVVGDEVSGKAEVEPEVIVSRGQLIEIGGGFRIPEVLEVSGAKLREVGTTNRTRLSDYERAISDATRAILWVHPSNFEVQGFTESVDVGELASLGQTVIADVGSGAFVPFGDEPVVQDVVAAGADITIFSGDKLLGGPQAGIVVGESGIIQKMKQHPLCRALRADKLCLAALEATLTLYSQGRAKDELPTLKMLHAPLSEVRGIASNLAESLSGANSPLTFDVVETVARSGGGTLPVYEIPSAAVRIRGMESGKLSKKLRDANVPVIGRVVDGAVILDARTLLPGDGECIRETFSGIEGEDE